MQVNSTSKKKETALTDSPPTPLSIKNYQWTIINVEVSNHSVLSTRYAC